MRRALHAEAPTVAIDKAQFIVNRTSLPEEVIAHRLGLIPIYVEAGRFEQMDLFYQCQNIGTHQPLDLVNGVHCGQCQALCEIDVSNETGEIITVTDRDIRFAEPQSFVAFSAHRECSPVPIVRLGPNQRLCVRMALVKAKGRVHAKWSPVAACPLVPRVTLGCDRVLRLCADERTAEHVCRFLTAVCPRGCFHVTGGQLVQVDADACVCCDECVRTPFECPCPGPAADFGYPFRVADGRIRLEKPVDVIPSDRDFRLTVETTGCQDPRQALVGALRQLRDVLFDV